LVTCAPSHTNTTAAEHPPTQLRGVIPRVDEKYRVIDAHKKTATDGDAAMQAKKNAKKMVDMGIEPMALALLAPRSNQLS
jgi:hypothetical protein